jgi:uncharacterized membrane protein
VEKLLIRASRLVVRRKPMKNCKSILCVVLGFALACAVAATAGDAPKLTFTFSKANVPGAMQTGPSGINNAGVMVGGYVDKNSVSHGYILNGKKLTTLDDPKAMAGTTGPENLNLNGAISVVGVYNNSSGNTVGFLYKNGKYTDIPGPAGAVSSVASGINDKGAIVGDYVDSDGRTHGFLLKGKKYTTLDEPAAFGTTAASGINNAGWIVLWYVDQQGLVESAITKDNGITYTPPIDVPLAVDSYASDLNSVGDVTYFWVDSAGVGRGALLHAGKYYKVNYPKAIYTYAGGINDKRTIVGGYQVKSKNGHPPVSGFEATYG